MTITLFGLHDRGGEHLMVDAGVPGWVLVTEAIGTSPNDKSSKDYRDLTAQGLKVIVRLNNGYGSTGTIPHPRQYVDFADRCSHFVAESHGCTHWIIGNEMNLKAERPGVLPILPADYADCFERCRRRIKRGRQQHQVIMGAVGPWNVETKYETNPWGDWLRYFRDTLFLLSGQLDGIALHTYTHGHHPGLITSEKTMDPPYQNRYYHFRAYRDFMRRIPKSAQHLPVYITETNQYGPWLDRNSGWVSNAYKEIEDWNKKPYVQRIHALILFRWIVGADNEQERGWAICDKPGVIEDFRWAMGHE